MDVFVTREAVVDLQALNVLCPRPSTWGLLIGHRRGGRFFVERTFPAGAAAALPPPARLEELDRLLERRVVGVFAVRPSAAFKKSLAGPYFYGRLFLDVRPSERGPGLTPFVVEFERVFRLTPVALKTGPEGKRP